MTEAIAIPDEQPVALTPWAKMDADQKVLLKQVCSGTDLNDSQFALLCEVGIRTGLDPFRRQIYGLIFDGKFQVVTGIDGFRAVARRNGLAGMDAPRFEYIDPEKRIPSACEITVYRWSRHGEKESYTVRGLFREYCRYTKEGKLQKNWAEKPHLMLAKCVEALAHRVAFTEWLGGVYERSEFPDETRGSARVVKPEPVSARALLAGAEPEPTIDAELEDADADPRDCEAP